MTLSASCLSTLTLLFLSRTASPSHPAQPAQGSFSHRLFVPVIAANLAGEKPGLEEIEGPGKNMD